MALIKCPECGREVSDKAQTCIHCGYPIPKPKVTLYNVCFDPNTKMTWSEKSDAKAFVYPYANKRLGGDRRAVTAEVACAARPGGYIDFGITQAQANRIAEAARACGFKVVINSYVSKQNSVDNKPRCPTCRSEKIERIGELERYIDSTGFGTIAGGGLNSPSLGKTFKCNNCGYRW